MFRNAFSHKLSVFIIITNKVEAGIILSLWKIISHHYHVTDKKKSCMFFSRQLAGYAKNTSYQFITFTIKLFSIPIPIHLDWSTKYSHTHVLCMNANTSRLELNANVYFIKRTRIIRCFCISSNSSNRIYCNKRKSAFVVCLSYKKKAGFCLSTISTEYPNEYFCVFHKKYFLLIKSLLLYFLWLSSLEEKKCICMQTYYANKRALLHLQL